MKIDRSGFIQYCNNVIKNNNKKIKGLRSRVNEYEAIIDVITKTDINKQILNTYRNKIEVCFNQIDRCLESNKNNYDMISAIKRSNKIIKDYQRGKICE